MNTLPVKEFEIDGHKIRLTYQVISKRSESVVLDENELTKVNPDNIINVQDLPLETYPAAEPEAPEEESVKKGDEHSQEYMDALDSYNTKYAEWVEKKKSWEELKAKEPAKKQVNLWVPVVNVVEAQMDGHIVKIYHTLRGPIMASVQTENATRARVYSPCFLDPNVQQDRIHFFPLAFAGHSYVIHKSTCVGESVPQEAEMQGYPKFVNRNRNGDYRFRMRAAYHHIGAGLPEDSQVLSIDLTPTRHPLYGLVPTTSTEEEKLINRARQAEAAQKQQAAQAAQRAAVEKSTEGVVQDGEASN